VAIADHEFERVRRVALPEPVAIRRAGREAEPGGRREIDVLILRIEGAGLEERAAAERQLVGDHVALLVLLDPQSGDTGGREQVDDQPPDGLVV